jgi:hypothetical protein
MHAHVGLRNELPARYSVNINVNSAHAQRLSRAINELRACIPSAFQQQIKVKKFARENLNLKLSQFVDNAFPGWVKVPTVVAGGGGGWGLSMRARV